MATTKSKVKKSSKPKTVRKPIDMESRRKLLTKDVTYNYPDRMNPLMKNSFLAMIKGMDINLHINSLYELLQFMHNSLEELETVKVEGFQEYWASNNKEQLQIWNLVTGSLPVALGYSVQEKNFIGTPVLEDSVGDLLRIIKTNLLWDLKIQYTQLEFKGDTSHLKAVMGMTNNQVAEYANAHDLNYGTTELEVSPDSYLHGIYLEQDDVGYTLSAIHKIKDEEDEDVHSTILSYAFEVIRNVVTQEQREHPEYKNFEVVNFQVKAKVAGF